MKPLSELRDKWERQSNAPTPTDEFQAANFHFDRGRQYCADELQVWLREAHTEEMPDWLEKAVTMDDIYKVVKEINQRLELVLQCRCLELFGHRTADRDGTCRKCGMKVKS